MRVRRTAQFTKKFRRLPSKTQQRFDERFKLWMRDYNNVILNVHQLSGKYKKFKTFNVTGDIRVWFYQDADGVYVLDNIGTHSQLY